MLIALMKDDVSPRPIGIDILFRRIHGLLEWLRHKSKVQECVGVTYVGFGVSHGMDAMQHLCTTKLEEIRR